MTEVDPLQMEYIELKQEMVFQESTDDAYTPLSANSLVYSFVPTSGDIVDAIQKTWSECGF